MNYEEIKRRLAALAREYLETHNPEIAVEFYFLACELEKMKKSEVSGFGLAHAKRSRSD
jgi:hypothetical protein